MNSIIIKVLIGLIVAGGGYYTYTASVSNKTDAPNVMVQKESAPESLSEKLLSGGNVTCDSTISGNGVEGKNVSYVSGTSIRTETDMIVGGKNIKSSMIVKGETMYIWTNQLSFGMKMKFDKDAFIKNIDGASMQLENTYEKSGMKVNYTCKPWSKDLNVFEIPANIIFQDMPQQQGGTANSIRTGNTGVTIESNTGGFSETKTNSLQVGGVNLKSTKPVNNATINIEGGEVKVQGSYGGYSF